MRFISEFISELISNGADETDKNFNEMKITVADRETLTTFSLDNVLHIEKYQFYC